MKICIYIYVYMYICTYVSLYICTYVSMYLCIYVFCIARTARAVNSTKHARARMRARTSAHQHICVLVCWHGMGGLCWLSGAWRGFEPSPIVKFATVLCLRNCGRRDVAYTASSVCLRAGTGCGMRCRWYCSGWLRCFSLWRRDDGEVSTVLFVCCYLSCSASCSTSTHETLRELFSFCRSSF